MKIALNLMRGSNTQHIFDFIKKYAQTLMLNSRNDIPDPDPFFMFFTGGAGVGKL